MTAASAGPKSCPTAEKTSVMRIRCRKSFLSPGTREAIGISATTAARPMLHQSMICLRLTRSAITPAGGANRTAGTVYASNVTATDVLPPEIWYARMISENRRNLSASCAASCENQMLRNAVWARAPRKPPGPSTGSLIGSMVARD